MQDPHFDGVLGYRQASAVDVIGRTYPGQPQGGPGQQTGPPQSPLQTRRRYLCSRHGLPLVSGSDRPAPGPAVIGNEYGKGPAGGPFGDWVRSLRHSPHRRPVTRRVPSGLGNKDSP
ncbi:hypothetical protein B5T_01048 [Alloalcanivorax dieselolei B5]|uniref:Uncharacterized protein n=1 Tax=Alcanivorax dieselolei (strain DSM 16502 / CGMCC 1.3690 / MCCC 1A00001 / B-5) TaxID=930169 RepID=K0CCE1_ALCDB|nr:hypothetical protein B5T_01048 [Alloalcanivorax dieselolei B5]